MDYMIFLKAMFDYIENRVTEDVKVEEVAEEAGFSLSHFRAVFKEATNESLAKYITNRKLNHAAFQLVNTEESVSKIAMDYSFSSHDVFTRAFSRAFGETPSNFRKNRRTVSGTLIVPGVFGPSVKDMEDLIMKNEMKKSVNDCILYGVPKVSYFESYEITPFISSLKACLRYLGQDISYPYLMAASGAAFRLIWNPECWDGGNIDILGMRKDPLEPLKRAFNAAGREFKMLLKKESFLMDLCDKSKNLNKDIKVGEKENFIKFIKDEIDQGRPVIGFGIVGPPEACIITGYKNNGEELVGWNFFQDMPEFAGTVEKESCGYFIRKGWYEDPMTVGVMSIGDKKIDISKEEIIKEILYYALDIMNTSRVNERLGGSKAFNAWAEAIDDDTQFPNDAPLPLLMERLMCHTDAMTMIGEGRWCAGAFLKETACEVINIEIELKEASKLFFEEHSIVQSMAKLLGGFGMGEKHARALGEIEIRKQLVEMIHRASQLDMDAGKCIKKALEKIG
ncbi:helix-turn-helix transcriptional regulator [Oceanirhabdus sp. W0125-5]|uniref:helix-turn-helix transcriptional regulator n=1 Tax=Oceanirhabdus sp. W0125-5 TaxID=2999116 RepID=UPI0022F2A842|nr:helix-turn-helix transcriptional regulator [Oceanirhabdus sp. W0125-5]WBW96743.1 helix-turn-helix transcriptional regulator [Oceanirhabdus sp. W0125-5]